MKNKDEIIDNLYARLEKIRVEKGMSKTEFSEQAGFSQNWYQQALKQKRNISYSDVMVLLEFYEKNQLIN